MLARSPAGIRRRLRRILAVTGAVCLTAGAWAYWSSALSVPVRRWLWQSNDCRCNDCLMFYWGVEPRGFGCMPTLGARVFNYESAAYPLMIAGAALVALVPAVRWLPITLKPARMCRVCKYDLAGLPAGPCQECGSDPEAESMSG